MKTATKEMWEELNKDIMPTLTFNEEGAEIISNCCNFESSVELGAGTGQLSYFLAERMSYPPTCVDYSANAARNIITLFNKGSLFVEVVLSNILEMHDYRKWEMVMSVGVIEHYYDDELKIMMDLHLDVSKKYVCFIVPSDVERNRLRSKKKELYGLWRPMTSEFFEEWFKEERTEDYLD